MEMNVDAMAEEAAMAASAGVRRAVLLAGRNAYLEARNRELEAKVAELLSNQPKTPADD